MLNAAEEGFEILLKESVSERIETFLSSVGRKRGRAYWTSYRTLRITTHEEVGLIRSKEGRLLQAPEEISKEFETTFFGGEPLKKQGFKSNKNNKVARCN